jgi:hypothetical protein
MTSLITVNKQYICNFLLNNVKIKVILSKIFLCIVLVSYTYSLILVEYKAKLQKTHFCVDQI